MTIELDDYGFMLDMGNFIYLSLSWAMLLTSAVIFTGAQALSLLKKEDK